MEKSYEPYAAIKSGDLKRIKRAFADNPDLCQVRPYGQSLILLAVFENQTALLPYLIERGCDLNDGDDEHGLTPLHAAALDHRLEAAKILLAHGAKVDAEDHYGNTPLYRAMFAYPDEMDMVRLLIKHGANPLHSNKSGVSPLDLAEQNQNEAVIKVLRER